MSDFVALLGLIVTLATSFLLDVGQGSLEARVQRSLAISPELWWGFAVDLVMVILLFALFWIVLFRSRPSLFTTVLYCLTGLFFVAFVPLTLSGIPGVAEFLSNPVFDRIRLVLLARGTASNFLLACEGVLAIGLATMIPRRSDEEA
jgi:uncharacterized membrane protein YczE